MRLVSLELAGFRGFANEQTFDLNADAVVVVGANGNGKTSLFDAILWAISGCVPRLGAKDSVIVSAFSETGKARVVLRLKARNQRPLTVTRVYDGQETRVSVETLTAFFIGPQQRDA
jgi:DNA repair exonuclease SbcCD ATPase subunit